MIKYLFVLITAIIFNSSSLFAQDNLPDYILKRNKPDTIWCKITRESTKYIYYSKNNLTWAVKKKDIFACNKIKVNTEQLTAGNPAPTSTRVDTIPKRPKILLDFSYTGSNSSHSTASMRLTFVDPATGELKMLGWRKKNIEEYLKVDAEAYRKFRASRRAGTLSWLSSAICLGTAVPVVISLSNSDAVEATPTEYVLSFTAIISGISAFVFAYNNDHYLFESVKIYNRNAGYGYINGLEKTKKASKNK